MHHVSFLQLVLLAVQGMAASIVQVPVEISLMDALRDQEVSVIVLTQDYDVGDTVSPYLNSPLPITRWLQAFSKTLGSSNRIT
jgi:hypothetical protein